MAVNNSIPQTEARLSQSVELRMVIPVEISFGVGVSYQLQPGTVIGTIQKLTRQQDRILHRRYSLGAGSFEPYDILPGRIQTSLLLEKVVLYSDVLEGATIDGDALSLFGFIGGNLLYQQKAFDIQEIVFPPEGTTVDSTPIITTYRDIWFRTNPISYDVSTSDAKPIIQTVEVWVGKVQTSIPANKAVAPLVKSLLPNGVKF
jgi:hypothetical protein